MASAIVRPSVARLVAALASAALGVCIASCVAVVPPASHLVDHPPDPAAPARAGGPLPGLTAEQLALFAEAADAFREIDSVTGGNDTSAGLGPRFNLNSCAGCHGFPAAGGSSGFVNPQPIVAKLDGARNDADIPFLRADGPVVEARFKWQMDARVSGGRRADGGVHALFTISGRGDAAGCDIPQPPLRLAWEQNNVSLRTVTPLFGLGLIEAISESAIKSNSLEMLEAMARSSPVSRGAQQSSSDYHDSVGSGSMAKMYQQLGIIGRPGRGRENRSGNDSSITRFGWKAQNKSLLLFAGEAYNVEQGVTNELFPNERDEEPVALPDDCKLNSTPEDDTRFSALTPKASDFAAVSGDLVKFELFMRMLAPPQPACDVNQTGACPQNIVRGSAVFDQVYCSACHIRQLKIGPSSIDAITRQRAAHLYSDLLLHRMGSCSGNADHTPRCLADDISQGEARGDEFRTAPLWGVGQRVFFLHDGRARDLPSAILAHRGPGSEANAVVRLYERLPDMSKQDLIDFLRSL